MVFRSQDLSINFYFTSILHVLKTMSSHWYLQFQYSDTEFVLDFSLFIFVILFSNGKKPGLSFFLLALKKIMFPREFRGGAVVRTWRFHCQGPSSVPGRRTKIPQAAQRGQKKKKKSHFVKQYIWYNMRFKICIYIIKV